MNTQTSTVIPASLLSAPPTLSPRFLEPEGLRWGRFSTADGASLRWALLPAPQPKALCVLVGGLSEFIEKYFETMRDLAQRGISVWCLDWRGQGGSERDAIFPTRPLARDYDRDAADLTAFITSVLPQSDLPRLLIAHSMGGAIGTLALRQKPTLVKAAILSAPMYAVRTAPFPPLVARTLARTACAAGLGTQYVPGAGPWMFNTRLNALTSITSHDEERCLVQRAWFETCPRLRLDGITYGWAETAFAVTARFGAPGFLDAVTTPILIGSAAREFFVNPTHHRRAAARLPDCKLVTYPGAKHELFMESDEFRAAWFGEIDAFIAARLLSSAHP